MFDNDENITLNVCFLQLTGKLEEDASKIRQEQKSMTGQNTHNHSENMAFNLKKNLTGDFVFSVSNKWADKRMLGELKNLYV